MAFVSDKLRASRYVWRTGDRSMWLSVLLKTLTNGVEAWRRLGLTGFGKTGCCVGMEVAVR